MPSEPTIFALQTDSAWFIILAVSLATLPVVVLLRRIINRPGGLASGVLLVLPLLLPVIAAVIYPHPVFPEVGVLQPATRAVLRSQASGLRDLLFLWDKSGEVVIPYRLIGSAGSWVLAVGVGLSCVMVLRRTLGMLAMRRLRARCVPVTVVRKDVAETVERLARSAGLRRVPEVLVLPESSGGAFATGTRRGRIILARLLLDELDPNELEALLAHELAHLKARDVGLVMLAGFLRDVVAWNPLGHLALRRLSIDRELEADRQAAALTGSPLTVASSLVRTCELMCTSRPRVSPGLSFVRRRRRIKLRVARLLAMADGPRVSARPSYLPYVAAAMLAVLVALQVGMRAADADSSALAVVWGAPKHQSVPLWAPPDHVWGLGKRATERRREGSRAAERVGLPPKMGATIKTVAVREHDLDRWLGPLIRRPEGFPARGPQGWGARLLIHQDLPGGLGVYRIESGMLGGPADA